MVPPSGSKVSDWVTVSVTIRVEVAVIVEVAVVVEVVVLVSVTYPVVLEMPHAPGITASASIRNDINVFFMPHFS